MDNWQDYGWSVKALGPRKFGGYCVLFGGPDRRDLSGEYFTRDTAELTLLYEQLGALPVLFAHGSDPVIAGDVVAAVNLMETRGGGVWFEAQLRERAKYANLVMELIARKALSISTGTLPRARQVAKDGRITRWPVVEVSLTTSPMEPRLAVRPVSEVKAIFEAIGLRYPAPGYSDETYALQVDLEKEKLAALRQSVVNMPSSTYALAGRYHG